MSNRTVQFMSEQQLRESVTQRDITSAIEAMYVAIARGNARNFSTVRESFHYADATFGFKSGIDTGQGLLGVKAGGYWRIITAADWPFTSPQCCFLVPIGARYLCVIVCGLVEQAVGASLSAYAARTSGPNTASFVDSRLGYVNNVNE